MLSYIRRRVRQVLVIMLFLTGVGCSSDKPDDKTPPDRTASPDSLVIEYAGADSVTVFDLLCADHKVDYQATASGVFVKGIDSIPSGDGYFWIYSVNDSISQVAADRYMTASTDRIKWHFRRAGN